MLTASDFTTGKQADVCPVNLMTQISASDPKGTAAQATIQTMVQHHVSMTSTLAVYEPFVANRPTKDERTLQAMDPEVRDAYLKQRRQIDSSGSGFVSQQAFKNAMEFDRAFVAAGGLLAAGVDPTGIGGALAGFGDQRNYELFIEAGFTPAQAVQIMTFNGAKILGVQQTLGSVETGKLADLVVLKGDLTADPSVIRSPTIVFKDGVGYDSAKLIASVQGRVGVN
ncbi:MAG TPA: amidohydrolase family protein, partial [Gemmatimonadales bacterium]|nr:amidohydrolase family protein [Gemmatimonadales bacterium]